MYVLTRFLCWCNNSCLWTMLSKSVFLLIYFSAQGEVQFWLTNLFGIIKVFINVCVPYLQLLLLKEFFKRLKLAFKNLLCKDFRYISIHSFIHPSKIPLKSLIYLAYIHHPVLYSKRNHLVPTGYMSEIILMQRIMI